MSLLNLFNQAIGQIGLTDQLRKADEVAKYIPPNAQYVTVANTMKISDPAVINQLFNESGNFYDLSVAQKGMDGETMVGYLFHDSANLVFLTQTETVFSVPLTQINRVVKSKDFMMLTIPQGHYLIGQVLPVQKNDNLGYRTWDGVALGGDNPGNWYKELQSLNVPCY